MDVGEVRGVSDGELRLRVAGLVGWRRASEGPGSMWFPPGDGLGSVSEGMVPDYACDLNAMRSAESLLSEEEPEEYADHLVEVMSTPEGCHPRAWLWHASARHRAEAYVLVRSRGFCATCGQRDDLAASPLDGGMVCGTCLGEESRRGGQRWPKVRGCAGAG